MAIKQRRKDLPENRRACILKAARCVFARQGYADTVVEDIAGQAGIGKGTLYLYFKSKEEIFLAALSEEARRLENLTRERMQASPTWQAKLQAYVDVRLEYLESNEDFLRIYLAEIRSMMVRGRRMSSDFFQCVRESEDHLAQVFAAAIAKGEIRQVDPAMAALTLSDLTRGLMERRLLGWSRPSGSADARFGLDLLCRALAAE
jgi:TetR/AcrR family transcriptional regulator, mexJK operon transcriptional repressor